MRLFGRCTWSFVDSQWRFFLHLRSISRQPCKTVYTHAVAPRFLSSPCTGRIVLYLVLLQAFQERKRHLASSKAPSSLCYKLQKENNNNGRVAPCRGRATTTRANTPSMHFCEPKLFFFFTFVSKHEDEKCAEDAERGRSSRRPPASVRRAIAGSLPNEPASRSGLLFAFKLLSS